VAVAPGNGGVLERADLKRWSRWAGAVAALALVLVVAWRLAIPGRGAPTRYDVPGTRMPYTVEVLNGTDVDGLARTVTRRLRQGGVDVVSYGTAGTAAGDSTLLVVRSADTAAAWAVREVLGFGRVVIEPDPRPLLDLTVILGRDAAGASRRECDDD